MLKIPVYFYSRWILFYSSVFVLQLLFSSLNDFNPKEKECLSFYLVSEGIFNIIKQKHKRRIQEDTTDLISPQKMVAMSNLEQIKLNDLVWETLSSAFFLAYTLILKLCANFNDLVVDGAGRLHFIF